MELAAGGDAVSRIVIERGEPRGKNGFGRISGLALIWSLPLRQLE
jgi:hypothetical protein